MSKETIIRVLKNPSQLIFLAVGIHEAQIGSDLAKKEFRDLLSSAQHSVIYASEQLQETDILFDLLDRKIVLHLVAGKSQDSKVALELKNKGADIRQAPGKIPRPLAVVDGDDVMGYDRMAEVPGARSHVQYISYANQGAAFDFHRSIMELKAVSKQYK